MNVRYLSVYVNVPFIDCIHDALTQTEVITFPVEQVFYVFDNQQYDTKRRHTYTHLFQSKIEFHMEFKTLIRAVTEMSGTDESQHIGPMCLLH